MTNAEEIPPKITPRSRLYKAPNPKSIPTPVIAAAETPKLYTAISTPLPNPLAKERKSIVNAPSKSRNNSANVVKAGATGSSDSGNTSPRL